MARNTYDCILVGAGAAGFFCALRLKEHNPQVRVLLLEKSPRTLQKVAISGGGRCNVTNGRTKAGELTRFYPRGQKKLHKLFERFGTLDMRCWLEKHGVQTHVEEDLRVFPFSNSSQTILELFHFLQKEYQIDLHIQEPVINIQQESTWKVDTSVGSYFAPFVVWATGSSESAWAILDKIGLQRNSPVPSLFTFSCKDTRIEGLSGLSFPKVQVKILSSSFVESGPLLITHWGFSGPAILKLSAWAARELAQLGYKFKIQINFIGENFTREQTFQLIQQQRQAYPNRKVKNLELPYVPSRYLERILDKIEIADIPAENLSHKYIHQITDELTQAKFEITGKSTFKEEFVTCGGVKLNELSLDTFETKQHPCLFIIGEAVDVDALTGGFNFQACWSAADAVAQEISQRIKRTKK